MHKIYLAELKMDDEEFDTMLSLFLKLRKKSSQNVKKVRRFCMRKFFEKHLFLCTFFDFCQTGKDISLLFWPVIPLGLTTVEVI